MATPRALWRVTTSPFLLQTPTAHHLTSPLTLHSCRFYLSQGRGNVRKRREAAAEKAKERRKQGREAPGGSGGHHRKPSSYSNGPQRSRAPQPFRAFEPSRASNSSTGFVFDRSSPPKSSGGFAFDISNSFKPATPAPFSKPATPASFAKLAPSPPAPTPPPPPKPQPLGIMSYLPPPSNDPQGRPIRGPAPTPADVESATTTFTAKPPTLVFSANRFLNVPLNEHTPEICVIGRSNVGKSTLINALGGAKPDDARHAHGAQARNKGLAITSRTAGSTQTMNAYGYGKPSKEQMELARQVARNADRQRGAADKRSRGMRRSIPVNLPPSHRLTIVDMPGYGHGSRPEWGQDIEKYLTRRKMLKGAVFLVDAEAGLKDADRAALEILKNAGVRTAVILTKAEKTESQDGKDGGGSRLDEVCMNVWQELRSIEAGSQSWLEGAEKGWEKEIWVTSAGDADVSGGAKGVAGARWAICRMAGMWDKGNGLAVKAAPSPAPRRVITSFEDIERQVAADARRSRNYRPRATF